MTRRDAAAPAAAGDPRWRLAVAAVLAAAFALAVWGGLARRGLYYDGAYFLLGRLSSETFNLYETARRAVHAMGQAPLVAAIRLELVGLPGAMPVHSLTLQVLPLALTAASFFGYPRGRRHLFIFALLHHLAGTLAAAVYPNTEPALAAAYFWLLLPLILFCAGRAPGFAALALLSLPCAITYEAMALLSPILAAAAPTLSILLAPGGRVTTLIAAPPGQEWTPFDPAKPDQIPRSRFYGLEPYLRAPAEQRQGRP